MPVSTTWGRGKGSRSLPSKNKGMTSPVGIHVGARTKAVTLITPLQVYLGHLSLTGQGKNCVTPLPSNPQGCVVGLLLVGRRAGAALSNAKV